MKNARAIRAAVVLAILATTSSAERVGAATEYAAIDLTPTGYTNCKATGVAGGQQVGYGTGADGNEDALVWNGSPVGFLNLTPAGFKDARINAANGTQMVGGGFAPALGMQVGAGLLWSGTSGSYTSLPAATGGMALGISGTQQVGYCLKSYGNDAVLWNGSAEDYVNLNGRYAFSAALGTNGAQQVGWGNEDNHIHALLWSGTAASAIDLTPSGFNFSVAAAISGTQQAGAAGIASSGSCHAAIWHGSADSFVDLNPSGWENSYVYGTNGTQQVGYGYDSLRSHAMLWNGSADSYVDLHQYLDSDLLYSRASSIDTDGNIVGYAIDSLGYSHAILWQPTPEPAALSLLALSGLWVIRRRRK